VSAWPFLPFDEAVVDASGGNLKTKQNDYLEQGSFAIVDQGKARIAGYTEDSAALCKAELPVVVFGDHTRCLKYVDFPFGMGADGVKVLRPRVELDVKFLFHYLRQLKLPDGGYDRHFKYLKRESIPVPPLEEQRRIAAILDQAETLRTQRHQALAHLDTLTQSLFLDMFGDPQANPMSWPTRELQEVVKPGAIVTYGIVQAGDELPGGVPYIRTGDLVNGSIRLTELRHTDPELAAKFSRSRVETNEIVMSIRATVGTTALVPAELDGANLTQGTARIAPGEDMHFNYLLYFLRSDSTQHWIDRQVKGATFREITLGRLRELPVLVPPLSLQQTFATRIQAIEALKATHRTALAELDALFASLQQRAFAGEL